MTAEVTKITLAVDSTSAKTAQVNLDAMAASGTASAKAFGAVEGSASTAAAALAGAAAAAGAGAKGTAGAAASAKTAADALKGTGAAAKLTGNQTAQLSAQLQDLFVQVQAGGSPLTALIQQGSQLSAVFGGIGPALRAVGSVVFSATAGLVALGAAAAGLGVAFLSGREQSADLARTLILTGNAAGLTEGQFNSLASAIASSTRTTIGGTRETLQGLAATGRLSGDALGQAAIAAQLLSKATGQSAAEIVKDFSLAAEAPARFAEEQNKAYHFLTAAQLDYIKTLDEQGRKQEALAQTLRLLNPRLQETAEQATGLGKAFGDAKKDLSQFLDGLYALGRATGPEERIAEIRRQLEELAIAGQKGYVFGPSAASLASQLDGLGRVADGARKLAAAQEAKAQKDQAGIAFDRLKEQSLTKQEQLVKALANANGLADQAGLSQSERAKVLADIRDKFSLGIDKARLDADLAKIEQALNQQVKAYQGAETVIEALRAAGSLTDADYYAKKRAFVALDQAAQEAALSAEIARMRRFSGTTQENIENQKRISDAVSKLAEARAGAATKNLLLTVQETSAQEALARAFKEVQIASADALTLATRRARLRAEDVGLGDQERQRLAEQESIAERFTAKKAQLKAELRNGRLRGKQEQFREELTLLENSGAAELAIAQKGFDARQRAQADYNNGASRALQNYLASAADSAAQTEKLFIDAFQGAEDALVKFVMTGKLDFKSLADSIVADLLRIIIKQQVIKPLADLLQGGSSGGSSGGGVGSLISAGINFLFGGGRATGGSVAAGGLYEINESGRGPGEILASGGRQYLLAAQAGSVDPNSGSGSGVVVHNTFMLSGPVDQRTQQQVAASAGQGVRRALARNT